jgi:hypothetical protein
MIEQTVEELTPIIGTRPACRALGVAPATIYRRRRPPEPQAPQAAAGAAQGALRARADRLRRSVGDGSASGRRAVVHKPEVCLSIHARPGAIERPRRAGQSRSRES